MQTDDERQLLERLGCDGVQGWHVAPPMPGCEVGQWIRSRQSIAPVLSLAHESASGA